MKTVRQLVDFIFHSSQEQDADLGESERTFLGELNQIEPAKVIDKQPLVAALKKAGIEGLSGKLVSDASGIHAEFDNSKDYAALVSQLLDAGKLYDLAAHGWVATFSDDTASLGDTPNFRVNFLDIGEVEPGETKGHKAEDEDILAMDREAVAAYKEVNDLKGRKDSLKPKDDEKVSESMALLDSLENAADVVARLLSRPIKEDEKRCRCGHSLDEKGHCEGCDRFPEKCDCNRHPFHGAS